MGYEEHEVIGLTVVCDVVLPMGKFPAKCLIQLFKVQARAYPFRDTRKQVVSEKYTGL